jgi:hypothetical protein
MEAFRSMGVCESNLGLIRHEKAALERMGQEHVQAMTTRQTAPAVSKEQRAARSPDEMDLADVAAIVNNSKYGPVLTEQTAPSYQDLYGRLKNERRG